ncbi:hypothetical protein B0H19DRAFT_1139949 [Mycena capillaripes]|nr:hypothetical protein B0H19DRAFT_1139949 [Mycena capillaripes]
MSSSEYSDSRGSELQNVGAIASPLLIGSLLNFFFFGTLLVQVYVYRLCFSKDSLGVKIVVYSILFAMTICTCLNGADVKSWYGTFFGDIQRFADPQNSSIYSPIMGSIIAMIVQLFFCYRIVVIQRAAWPLSIAIALISMAQLAGGVGSGIGSYIEEFGTNVFNPDDVIGLHTRPGAVILYYLWLIGGPVADVLIAVTMTYLLLQAQVTSSTRDLVKDVVQLVLETNAFSAAVALLALALYVGLPNTPACGAAVLALPGVYANTLLATLNNRAVIKRLNAEDPAPSFINMSTFASHNCVDATAAKAPQLSPSTVESGYSDPMSFARPSGDEHRIGVHHQSKTGEESQKQLVNKSEDWATIPL